MRAPEQRPYICEYIAALRRGGVQPPVLLICYFALWESDLIGLFYFLIAAVMYGTTSLRSIPRTYANSS